MISRWTLCFATTAVAWLALQAEAAEPFAFGSPSAVTRASDMKGHIVETRDGEELGRIHDFAVDLASGRIAYVVVSVGSFLIEDSLIAVAPGALRESADADGRLVLETDAASLRNARRFSANDWPVRADVLAVAREREVSPGQEADSDAVSEQEQIPSGRGTATISSRSKTATLSAGERNIRTVERPQAQQAPQSEQPSPTPQAPPRGEPTTQFERLDRNGDGVLNRAEIAHELTRRDSYSDIDLDGNGSIDPMEFDALVESR
jgi:sporulation protein YlmC with PRC-barrel domain